MPANRKPLNILVVRYRFLGDTILTVPFLKRLREAHPEAHISVLIGPQSGVLLQNCPYIDQLINFDTTRFHKYDLDAGKSTPFWNYAWELRKQNFDTAFILKRSFSSALLAWLAGIPKRIGFDTEGRGFLLTKKITFDPKRHEVLNFLDHLPQPYKEPPAKSDRLFWPTEAEKQKAKIIIKSLNSEQKKILIHAPAAHPLKMWTIRGWSELLKKLKEQNHQIVFSGAASDGTYYKQIEELSGLKADLNLCELNNTLRENVAIYQHCNLAICVDSGPMHLAAAVGLPVLALFGPSDPVRWHPWCEKYWILQPAQKVQAVSTQYQDRALLEELSVDEVWQTFLTKAQLLKS
jgi:heptosyltransferase II